MHKDETQLQDIDMSGVDRLAVVRRARSMWDEMNAGFPAFTRQRWEDGTALAKDATLIRALHELYPHTAIEK